MATSKGVRRPAPQTAPLTTATAGDVGRLYYGDNLDVLREHVKDESVDLIYLDPPFKSNQAYNVLFKERDGKRAASQIQAFTDTWKWDASTEYTFRTVVERGGRPAEALLAFRTLVGRTDMLAYLTMMAPRLVELHRALKPTGSLYLHCDPTASHYLKLLLDAIFSPKNFRSEANWRRSSAHNDGKQGRKQYGNVRDVLFFYTKGGQWTWNWQYTPYTDEYLESEYRHLTPDGRRFKASDATANKPGGDVNYDWRVKRRKIKNAQWEADLDDEYRQPILGMEYKAVYLMAVRSPNARPSRRCRSNTRTGAPALSRGRVSQPVAVASRFAPGSGGVRARMAFVGVWPRVGDAATIGPAGETTRRAFSSRRSHYLYPRLLRRLTPGRPTAASVSSPSQRPAWSGWPSGDRPAVGR